MVEALNRRTKKETVGSNGKLEPLQADHFFHPGSLFTTKFGEIVQRFNLLKGLALSKEEMSPDKKLEVTREIVGTIREVIGMARELNINIGVNGQKLSLQEADQAVDRLGSTYTMIDAQRRRSLHA